MISNSIVLSCILAARPAWLSAPAWDIVTPTEARSFAAFTYREGVTLALTALVLQWALKTALQEYHLRSNRHD